MSLTLLDSQAGEIQGRPPTEVRMCNWVHLTHTLQNDPQLVENWKASIWASAYD